MSEQLAYFVRHGRYSSVTGSLNKDGNNDAATAGQLLYGKGVRSDAIILSSAAPRAVETAEIIQYSLEAPAVYKSELIEATGLHPRSIRSLRRIIDLALAYEGVELDDRQLVVVTHEPVMLALSNKERIRNGEVLVCDINWVNEDFSQHAENTYLADLLADDA
jgi:phosphohistidine phosphatase SixA